MKFECTFKHKSLDSDFSEHGDSVLQWIDLANMLQSSRKLGCESENWDDHQILTRMILDGEQDSMPLQGIPAACPIRTKQVPTQNFRRTTDMGCFLELNHEIVGVIIDPTFIIFWLYDQIIAFVVVKPPHFTIATMFESVAIHGCLWECRFCHFSVLTIQLLR